MKTNLRLLIVMLLTLLVPVWARAQGFCANGSPFNPNPAPPQRPPSVCCTTCENCNRSPALVGSGIYVTRSVDLSIPTNGFPLVLSRYYESAHAVDGPTGYGWISNLSAHLYYGTYLATPTFQKLAQVVFTDGSLYQYAENPDGTFTPPSARFDQLMKNSDGTFDLRIQHTNSKYHFGTDGALLSMTDDYGNALAWSYDVNGRLQQVSDTSGSGRFLNVFWGPDGRISNVQDSANRVVRYTYDGSSGVLTTVTDPLNRNTTYGYQPGHFSKVLNQIKDNWNRVLTDVTWTPDFKVESYTEKGEKWSYTYNNNGTTTKKDSIGTGWVFTFDGRGLVLQDQAPSNRLRGDDLQTYVSGGCNDGLLSSRVDGRGVRTEYSYTTDCRGNIAEVRRDVGGPLAVNLRYTYDTVFPHQVAAITAFQPSGSVDLNWQARRYDYYPLGSPAPGALFHAYRIHDDGVTSETVATYEYNSHGRVTKSLDALGASTDYSYDAAGNLATTTPPSNDDSGARPVTSYGYDVLGRTTSVTDPLSHVTSYEYDLMDRLTFVRLPKPTAGSTLDFRTTHTYDLFEATTQLVTSSSTDPNGAMTQQRHNQFGQLVKGVDAAGKITAYSYSRGRLASITDANNYSASYFYDILGRLEYTLFPGGREEDYYYYQDDMLKAVNNTFPNTTGTSVTYDYDHLRRLSKRDYTTFTYVGQKLTSIVDNDTLTFSYDTNYRLASEKQDARGTVSYSYLTTDSVASMAASGGPTTSYTYYPDASVKSITWSPVVGAFNYLYTPNGQYKAITFPNGQTRNFSYDDQGRLAQLSNIHPVAGSLATYSYEYDIDHATALPGQLGQRTGMTSTLPSQGFTGAPTNYYYDRLYQLTKVDYPPVAPFSGQTEQWTYDALGNRTSTTVNTSTTPYTYQKIGTNPNNWQRLLSDGVASFDYTFKGNLSSRTDAAGTVIHSWDNYDRLTALTGAVTATYRYDYKGRRTSASNTAGTKTYLYDGGTPVSDGSAVFLSGPGIDEPLAMYRDGSAYYYAVDGLGSPSLLTDSGGVVKNSYVYDAWGKSKVATEMVPQPFQYAAREQGDGGEMFYRARYYRPDVGRFLSEDPLPRWFAPWHGFIAEALHPYGYAENQPTMQRDPLGLRSCGPYPTPTRACAADVIARREWSLCAVRNQLNLASNLDTYLLGGAIGAAAVFTFGKSVTGTCIGAAIGVAAGYLWSQNAFAAAEQTIINSSQREMQRCQQDACIQGNPPPNLCRQSLQ